MEADHRGQTQPDAMFKAPRSAIADDRDRTTITTLRGTCQVLVVKCLGTCLAGTATGCVSGAQAAAVQASSRPYSSRCARPTASHEYGPAAAVRAHAAISASAAGSPSS